MYHNHPIKRNNYHPHKTHVKPMYISLSIVPLVSLLSLAPAAVTNTIIATCVALSMYREKIVLEQFSSIITSTHLSSSCDIDEPDRGSAPLSFLGS